MPVPGQLAVLLVNFGFLVVGATLALLAQPCTADTGGFGNTGSLATARAAHTATLLPNGLVLAAGGFQSYGSGIDLIADAELYNPASGTWTATGSLATARSGHTATLLLNGMVLVAGGKDGVDSAASAELYDPATGSWRATGSLATARYLHTATLLPNGMVLVAGGEDISNLNVAASAELYDPATGSWRATGSLATARYLHTATLLQNGMVLVAGGEDISNLNLTASAELYNPASGTWTATGSLATARERHTATLLPDGMVLVAGGFDGQDHFAASAELYDPATGSWTATGSLATARVAHTATLLPNGMVLVAGGYDNNFNRLTSAELYDPATGAWTATGSLANERYLHTATLLQNGLTLVGAGYSFGVFSSAELYGQPAPTPTPTPTPTPAPTPTPPAVQLLNISTRCGVETGDSVLIGGFIITGTQPKQVILRAIGPSLPLAGTLADPILYLYNGSGTLLASNDNWGEALNRQEIIDSGIPPANDFESAILLSLPPGLYTAIVAGVNNTSGIALVEVYDLNTAVDSKLANISTRGPVLLGNGVLIGGFILGPDSDKTTSVVVRAIGPSLAAAGVTNPLLDPTLAIYDSSGNVVASNDNWGNGPDAGTISADNLAPTLPNESALLILSGPGAYTAIVSGVGGTTGNGLMEVYNLQ